MPGTTMTWQTMPTSATGRRERAHSWWLLAKTSRSPTRPATCSPPGPSLACANTTAPRACPGPATSVPKNGTRRRNLQALLDDAHVLTSKSPKDQGKLSGEGIGLARLPAVSGLMPGAAHGARPFAPGSLGWVDKDVQVLGKLVRECAVDLACQVFDLVRGDGIVEVHPGGHDEAVRAHVHGLQLKQPVYARHALYLVADQVLVPRISSPADEQVLAVEAELDGDHDQQDPDRDRGPAVPGRCAGQLPQADAHGREDQADERRAVLEQGGLDRRVAACFHVAQHRSVRTARFTADL